MGKIKQGILGGVSGKVANVVGGSWKGIAYLRAKPLSVANPKTAGQVAQRTKMSVIVGIAEFLLASIIKPLNDRFAQKMSGYNEFVKMNIANITAIVTANYEGLKISKGNLLNPPFTAPTPANGNTSVQPRWTDNSGDGNALASDIAYGVVCNVTQNKWYFKTTGVTRADEIISIDTDALVTGDKIAYGVAFLSADKSKVTLTELSVVTVSV